MIRVNGWTNHMEKIGNKEYNVSVDSYKNYLVKIYNGAEIFPSQTVTFGDLGKGNSSILDPYKRELKEKEKENMKKTIDLLEKVVKMGFSREKALRDIDASLDEELGTENRKPLMEEEIPDQLYEDILFGFKCEAEEP